MPVKNAAPFLEACVESIIRQSEKNWELIAVDDHSIDESWQILEKYHKLDSRIQVFRNKEKGIITALKLAYSHSKGALIHRMDSDDFMPDDKISKLKKILLIAGKGHVVTARVKYFGLEPISAGYRAYENWINKVCNESAHWKNIYRECVIASPCWLIFREDFEKCGAFNSELYPEDYDLVFRFYQNKLRVRSHFDILHYWREHSLRTSRTHPHYNQHSFIELKLYYFLKIERDFNKRLIVLASGIKAKIAENYLIKNQQDHLMIGKKKSEKTMESIKSLISDNRNQVIVLFSDFKGQERLKDYFNTLNMAENKDFFFFS